MTLPRALKLLDAGDRTGALDVLLEQWRATRAPEIADVIDVISADLDRTLPAIEGKTRQAFQERWLDVAGLGDAADLGRLLAGFLREPCPQISERLKRLEVREHDPRLSKTLAAMVGRCPCTSTPNFPMWTRVFKQLQALGDVRIRPALESRLELKRVSTFDELLHARLEKLLAALVDPPALSVKDAADVKRLDALARTLLAAAPGGAATPSPAKKKSPQVESELIALVAAEPTADAPRLVYADWLSERGDPRGEFIALQFKKREGPLPAARLKREKALLREHGRRWLGALEPVIDHQSMEFERGFLSACDVRFRTDQQRKELLGHPLWATVARLNGAPLELLASPNLRSLRRVGGLTEPMLAKLCDGPPLPWEELAFALLRKPAVDREKIGAGRALGAVRQVTVQLPDVEPEPPGLLPEELSWLLGGELGRRLESLGLKAQIGHTTSKAGRPDLGAWVKAAAALPRLRTLHFDVQLPWRQILERDGDRWRLILETDHPRWAQPANLRNNLAGLALESISAVVRPAVSFPGLDKLLARFG